METKIEKIDKNKINEEIIEEAGMILKNGGLVGFSTGAGLRTDRDGIWARSGCAQRGGGDEDVCGKRATVG